jgi:DNA-directed RNA polymerase specialized sigma24 family protein
VIAPGEAIAEVEFDLERAFRAYYGRVARIIARVVRDRGRAEELAVEVLLKRWRTQRAQGEYAEAWLYRAAVRTGLNELRRQTRQTRYERLLGFGRRFRNHTTKLFEKHGMTNVAYWVPQDAPASQNTLIYVISHATREAAKKNWAEFGSVGLRACLLVGMESWQFWHQPERWRCGTLRTGCAEYKMRWFVYIEYKKGTVLLKPDVYQNLLLINMGFDQVVRSIVALRKHHQFHANYARRRNRCRLVEGATPFGTLRILR